MRVGSEGREMNESAAVSVSPFASEDADIVDGSQALEVVQLLPRPSSARLDQCEREIRHRSVRLHAASEKSDGPAG